MKTVTMLGLLALLLLAGCPSGPSYENFYTGSDGVVLSFEENTPPPEVYEGTDVPIVVQLWNKGASPVNFSKMIFNLTGDAFYVEIIPDELQDLLGGKGNDQEIRDLLGMDPGYDLTLYGREYGWPEGESLAIYPLVHFNEILGQRESPTTQIFARLCYEYETRLETTLCVDANAFNGNKQQQACSAQTLTFRDQGAPIAVTEIENRPTPVRVMEAASGAPLGGRGFLDIVQPVFILHLTNVGPGTVLRPPTASAEELASSCGLDIPSNLLNAVRVEAALSGLPMECEPNPVRLVADQGYTRCHLPYSENVPLATPNYEALFTARIKYLYRQGTAADVEIIRALAVDLPGDVTYGRERDENPGYINGMEACSYCSSHPNDPECQRRNWDPKNDTWVFSCSCSNAECLKKQPEGKCDFGYTWCPGSNQCCVPGR